MNRSKCKHTQSVATQSLDDGTKIHLVRDGQGRINAQVAHRADGHLITRQCTEDSGEFSNEKWSHDIRQQVIGEQATGEQATGDCTARMTADARVLRSPGKHFS